jgi:plastocyanin
MSRAPRQAMRSPLLVLVTAVLLLALAGCGSGGTDSASTSSSQDSSDSVTIDITIKDKAVKPSGSKVEVKAGTPIHLRINSDMDGELHVHSSPEQHIDFKAGSTEKTLTIKQPGVVDVEIHSLDKLVVQLEVS